MFKFEIKVFEIKLFQNDLVVWSLHLYEMKRKI